MMLSILIPSIPDREEKLLVLVKNLFNQKLKCESDHPALGTIQVLIDKSEPYLKGGPSIGKKRERLVQSVKGEYCCFLDDDDRPAPNYVETLLRLCNQDKDICTFRSLVRLDTYWCLVDMRLGNPDNEQARPDIIQRQAWHQCPVRSEFAKLYEFEDSNYGEDFAWMKKVLGHCKSEAHSPAILHEYIHSSKHSEADKIVNHGIQSIR